MTKRERQVAEYAAEAAGAASAEADLRAECEKMLAKCQQMTKEIDEWKSERIRALESELKKIAAILQYCIPAGELKAIGLLECSAGVEELWKTLIAERKDALDKAADKDADIEWLEKFRDYVKSRLDGFAVPSDFIDRRLDWLFREFNRKTTECDHYKTELEKIRSLSRQLSEATSGNYWNWQDDGHDHPESLTCPVIVSPEIVRRWVAAEQRLKYLADLSESLFK